MTVIGRSILAEFICRLNYSNLRRQFSLQNLKSPTWPSKKLPASTSISSMLPEGGIENALDPANATQKVCLQDGFARRELCKFLFSTCLSDDFQWVLYTIRSCSNGLIRILQRKQLKICWNNLPGDHIEIASSHASWWQSNHLRWKIPWSPVPCPWYSPLLGDQDWTVDRSNPCAPRWWNHVTTGPCLLVGGQSALPNLFNDC